MIKASLRTFQNQEPSELASLVAAPLFQGEIPDCCVSVSPAGAASGGPGETSEVGTLEWHHVLLKDGCRRGCEGGMCEEEERESWSLANARPGGHLPVCLSSLSRTT